MKVSTQTKIVVEVAGLHFQISRLRARRGLRGIASLIDLIGASAVSIITGNTSNGITSEMLVKAAKDGGDGGMSGLGKMLVKAAIMGGHMHDPDTVERVANELLSYTENEGVQVSTDGKSWQAVRGLASLDSWEMLGYMEMLDLLRHVIKFQFFPTSAGSPTSGGTDPADATTGQASAPTGANSGPQASAQTGVVAG